MTTRPRIEDALRVRFDENPITLKALGDCPNADQALSGLAPLVLRASCRSFEPLALEDDLVRLVASMALSAPSKSDLQQADIIYVRNKARQTQLGELVPSMPWVATAPALLVICANNRRQRQNANRRAHAFANDHLDAFFNCSVDAALVLAHALTAAQALGLGSCPVSVLRDRSAEVSEILDLPDHVFALCGLVLGWPKNVPDISPRLDLDVTFHIDGFKDNDEGVDRYDQRRRRVQPYAEKRRPDLFGEVADYGWREDKARQYALPQRADFGAFIRRKGFCLE